MSTTIESGAENRTQTLPPGPRDWAAYRLVKVQQVTTREAAKQLGISQTRVCQLIARVLEYMTDVAPGCESPEARGRRLYIAESVAAERIDFLFGKVVESFQKSTGPVTSNNAGTTRLALAAARLATMGGKLPANALLPELPDDLPVEDLPAEEFCDDNPVHCPDHPVEGCSRTSPEEAVSTTAAANAADVTVAAATASAKSAELAAMLRFLDSRPVQAAGENETWNSFVRQEMMHSPFLQAVLAEG